MRAAQKLLGAPTIGGGAPGQGVVVEGVKGVKQVSMPPRIYKNSTKNEQFPALVDRKITENAVFTQKFLIRYTPKTFLRIT